MGKEIVLKSDKIVVKSNELIEARYGLNVNEQKFILNYISKINYKKQEEIANNELRISVKQFAEELRYEFK
jgi:hypothetical protein